MGSGLARRRRNTWLVGALAGALLASAGVCVLWPRKPGGAVMGGGEKGGAWGWDTPAGRATSAPAPAPGQPADAGAGIPTAGAVAPAPPGDPMVPQRFVAAHTKSELELLSRLARSDLRPPPALDQLFGMRKRGATTEELIGFLQREFPPDLELRVLTLRWIKASERKSPGNPPPAPQGLGGRGPQGVVEAVPAKPVR
jgi:hypothetical protein